MKRTLSAALAVILMLTLVSCQFIGGMSSSPVKTASAGKSVEPATAIAPVASPSPVTTPSPASTAVPTPAPSPAPTPFVADTPDKAGEKGVQFDIYINYAMADLDGDGTPDQVELTAGDASSEITIDGVTYAVNKPGLAQLFAIVDVDKSDKTLEIVLTDKFDAGLADSEKAFSWLYWWNGTSLLPMGGLMDVKFDGGWRTGFHSAAYFNGAGQVTCLARTTELTDIWYMARYKPAGTNRALKETNYEAKLVGHPDPIKVKICCLLLKKVTNKFFAKDYYSLYDPASWPHSDGRLPVAPTTADYTVIAQAGEKLTVVAVYGPNWVKLRTADGYAGWIKVVDHKVQGYWQVVKWKLDDMFSGLMSAG